MVKSHWFAYVCPEGKPGLTQDIAYDVIHVLVLITEISVDSPKDLIFIGVSNLAADALPLAIYCQIPFDWLRMQ